ncbi:hypothetical protein D3C71_1379630 [compost metagenome]
MLVFRDDQCLTLALGDGHRRDFAGKPAVFLGGSGLVLTAQSKRILIFARDPIVFRNIFAGFGHGIDTVKLLHQRIYEAPADCRVVDLRVARKRGVGLRHDERCPAHAFDAARNHQLRLTRLDGARRSDDGIHSRTAQTVDGRARDGYGKPRK